MRDILLFVVILSLAPLAVMRPHIGIYTWSWLSYMNPHRLTWGIAFNFPFAQVIGAATLVGFVIQGLINKKFPRLPREREVYLLILLWALFLFSTFFAIYPDEAWAEFSKISKILIFTFLTILLIDDEKKLRYLLFVIAFSLGFYGIKGGIFSILTGGNHRVWGPPGTFFEDNNAIGLALNMLLPMLFFLAQSEDRKKIKILLYGAFSLTVLSVIFTYSRGAFVGLLVVFFFILLSFKMKYKIAVAMLFFFSGPLIISQIPDKYFERVETIKSYDTDASALSRLAAWAVAFEIAKEHPMTGGGFEVVNEVEQHLKHRPKMSDELATAHISGVHSVYLEILGENGFVTFTVFMLLMVSTIFSLRKARKIAVRNDYGNIVAYTYAIEISIYAYAVSGIFLELGSFDLYYALISITIIINTLLKQKIYASKQSIADVTDSARINQAAH